MKNLETFLDLSSCISENPVSLSHTLRERLANIKERPLQEICVFFYDDFFIQKFGEHWLPVLLEKHFYCTNRGGEIFYERLEEYFKTTNKEMIGFFLLALQLGFRGKEEQYPLEVVKKCREVLRLTEEEAFIPRAYQAQDFFLRSYNYFHLVLPFFLGLLIYEIQDFLLLKTLSSKLIHISSQLREYV